jgi:hypothetical protein
MKGRRMKRRGREFFSFFFLYSEIPFSNPFLKTVLNHFKFWIKTRQYSKTNAPACMQHVSGLMIDLNLAKIYYFLTFECSHVA